LKTLFEKAQKQRKSHEFNSTAFFQEYAETQVRAILYRAINQTLARRHVEIKINLFSTLPRESYNPSLDDCSKVVTRVNDVINEIMRKTEATRQKKGKRMSTLHYEVSITNDSNGKNGAVSILVWNDYI